MLRHCRDSSRGDDGASPASFTAMLANAVAVARRNFPGSAGILPADFCILQKSLAQPARCVIARCDDEQARCLRYRETIRPSGCAQT